MARGRTYRQYKTRLRFEPGQPIPHVGDMWIARTELGRVLVKVRLHEITHTFPHPTEPGVTLMDARISRSEVR